MDNLIPENLIPTNIDEFDKQLHDGVEIITRGLIEYGSDFVAALIVFIIGWWIASFVEKFVARALSRIKHADTTLVNFISTTARYGVLIVTIIAVLARFGVQTTSLIAILGAAGLAIGLALQGTLSNVAAGVMLLLFRPYRIGHAVDVAGQSGTVKNLGLFTTELVMANGVQIIIPNNSIWGSAITNYSVNPTRQMDIDINVGYGDNANKILDAMKKAVEAEPRILKDKDPTFFVKSLNETTITLTARLTTKNGDFWSVRWAVHKAIKEMFDAQGIEIPSPPKPLHVIEYDAGDYKPAQAAKRDAAPRKKSAVKRTSKKTATKKK